jgi:hypothetical protein
VSENMSVTFVSDRFTQSSDLDMHEISHSWICKYIILSTLLLFELFGHRIFVSHHTLYLMEMFDSYD